MGWVRQCSARVASALAANRLAANRCGSWRNGFRGLGPLRSLGDNSQIVSHAGRAASGGRKSLGALLVLCTLLALVTSACNPEQERRYYREGIGNDLYWSDLPESTRLQQLYVGYICEQAAIPYTSQNGFNVCDEQNFQSVHWATFVQAGMNDIDLRCDSYLSWLDDKKRTTQPIIKQIGDMSVVTQSIMRLTGVGADPITIVGLAFGLAADTFSNVRSRLLLEVNHSTVQTVVLSRQREYRMLLLQKRIDNRPAAMHALRSYLRLCMPFTIEMEINNTVVAYERGGPGALYDPSLITPATIRPALTARDPITRPIRLVDSDPRYVEFIENYFAGDHTRTLIQPILTALCAPPENEMPRGVKFVDYTKDLIQIYEAVRRLPPKRNRKLDQEERDMLSNEEDCREYGQKNYFEKTRYANGIIPQDTVDNLFNPLLPADKKLPANPKLKDSRPQIAEIRRQLQGRLQARKGFDDQITQDMISLLERERRRAPQ